MKDKDPGAGFSASRLRELRRGQGLTQRALARAAGLSQPLIAELERGKHPPSSASLKKIIAVLGPGLEAAVDRPD